MFANAYLHVSELGYGLVDVGGSSTDTSYLPSLAPINVPSVVTDGPTTTLVESSIASHITASPPSAMPSPATSNGPTTSQPTKGPIEVDTHTFYQYVGYCLSDTDAQVEDISTTEEYIYSCITQFEQKLDLVFVEFIK